MSRVLQLTKVFFKNSFFSTLGFSNKKKSSKTKKILLTILFVILILFSLVTIIGLIYQFSFEITKAMIEISPSFNNLFISLALPVVSLFLFITSIFTTLSFLYLSTDTDKIIYLPIKPWEILLARLILVYIASLFIDLIIMIPLLIGVANALNSGILYYFYGILIILFLPIIPLVISSILTMILMRFVSLTKFRQTYIYIASIFGIILGIGISFGFQSISIIDINQYDFTIMIELIDKYVALIFGNIFPFVIPAIFSLAEYNNLTGLLFFLAYIVINALLLIFCLIIGSKLYFKGLKGNSESYSNSKKITNKDYRDYQGIIGYSKKEFISLIRSPMAFLNTVLPILIMPVILIISLVISFLSNNQDISQLLGEININWNNSSILFYIIAIILFLCSVNLVSSTAFSREGITALHIKYLPIKASTVIYGKMTIGFILNILIFILIFIPVAIILKINHPFYYTILPLIVILLSYLTNYLSLYIDLRNPKIHWDNEIKALKQNFTLVITMLIEMFIAIGFMILGIFITFMEIDGFQFSIYLSGAILFIILLLISAIIHSRIKNYNSNGVFNKIQ